ncbi:hypothetical protein BDY19DRAFT_1024467 [Irpex rosettiformis]|uniref:Uncharacterized protein n=1 Tax=Irpex rosettiformis TaxID=378272 RepID=A0ACB8UF70_9APHY|nr:hypothetical protein BDY19DRAFT_1024467 [Irpex rosettiformis]
MAPKRRCVVCGSKQWRKEPSSGLITCSEGHVLQNYRNETSEVNELGPHTVRKRALKTGRKKKERVSKADPKLYHGDRGRYHYYQCLQLLLRLQIKVLTDAWHLPPEFEVVCRDVWTLHLCLLPQEPPAEPYHHLVEQYGGKRARDSGQGGEQPLSEPIQQENADVPEDEEKDDDHNSAPSSSSSSSSSDDEDQLDDEMERLLRENSEASSSDEEDQLDPSQPIQHEQAGRRKRSKDPNRGYESPASNLAVLMVACWTMRVPLMYMDFIKLINSYDLPYLDPVRLLPDSLTLHLTKQTRQALSPHFAPTTIHIHKLASRLAKLMYSKHGIYTPEYNAAPTLWRAVTHLHGTPTLYIFTKKLSHVISLTLTLHRTLSPTLRRIKPLDPEYHKLDNAPVEVSLSCAVIVVLKLMYGLDGKKRTPRDSDDPACAMPNFKDWIKAVREMEKKEGSTRERLFDVGEDMPSALELDDTDMDSYLDFCEKALLPQNSSSNRKDENIILRDFFPLQPSVTSNDIPFTPSSPPIKPLPATSLPTISTDLRPGQSYKIYHASDILGAFPQDYEFLIKRVAKWTGVSEEYVCGVVERYERRLARWWDKVKKEEKRKSAGSVGRKARDDEGETK